MKVGWKLFIVLLAVLAAAAFTTPWWSAPLARSLVCAEQFAPSDAILVENFDVNYLVFERAAALEKRGLARVSFVPVEASSDPNVPNAVSAGIADVMARQARLRAWHMIPITQ